MSRLLNRIRQCLALLLGENPAGSIEVRASGYNLFGGRISAAIRFVCAAPPAPTAPDLPPGLSLATRTRIAALHARRRRELVRGRFAPPLARSVRMGATIAGSIRCGKGETGDVAFFAVTADQPVRPPGTALDGQAC